MYGFTEEKIKDVGHVLQRLDDETRERHLLKKLGWYQDDEELGAREKDMENRSQPALRLWLYNEWWTEIKIGETYKKVIEDDAIVFFNNNICIRKNKIVSTLSFLSFKGCVYFFIEISLMVQTKVLNWFEISLHEFIRTLCLVQN